MFVYACSVNHVVYTKEKLSGTTFCTATVLTTESPTMCESCKQKNPREEVIFQVKRHKGCTGLYQGRVIPYADLCNKVLLLQEEVLLA